MAVTIELLDGSNAVIQDRKWKSDAKWKRVLESYVDRPFSVSPDPDYEIAKMVVEEIGGEILLFDKKEIHFDPDVVY